MLLRARVTGHSTAAMHAVRGASVRMEFMDAERGGALVPGGWVLGIRAAHEAEDAFVPAIGGAPGGERHGRLDVMVMAQPFDASAAGEETEEPHVTFVREQYLARWLPIDSVVAVSPIWLCDDFRDLRMCGPAGASSGGGSAVDANELSNVLHRLSERSADRVVRMHKGAPWYGALFGNGDDGHGGASEIVRGTALEGAWEIAD